MFLWSMTSLKLARRYMRRERSEHTLQTTALVHEAYLKLVGQHSPHWQNRAQFYGTAAQLMRRILIDHARRHLRAKRGGTQVILPWKKHWLLPRNTPKIC